MTITYQVKNAVYVNLMKMKSLRNQLENGDISPKAVLEKITALTGREYHLFNYYGDPQAERVIVAMGSVSGTIQDTVDLLRSRGE